MEKKESASRFFGALKVRWRNLLRRQVALASIALMVVVTVAGLFYLATDWSSLRYPESEEYVWPEPPELPLPTEAPQEEKVSVTSKAPSSPKPAAKPVTTKEATEVKQAKTEPARELGTAEPGPEPKEPLQPVLAPGQAFPDLVRPVMAEVSSPFGWRKHPVFADWRFHPGVDLAAPVGTEVKAVLAGTVAEVKDDAVLGKVVVIDHGQKRRSTYGHLERVDVQVGQAVEKGQPIGTVGQTGVASEPHLHLELRLDKEAVDPSPYLPEVAKEDKAEVNARQ
ncbi:MAG: hypothetical protein PWQ41_511 [Bacillota bacterium]|jgi:murein DD-endopeptidase MepM/ murein hydrolase activator NlpD|nr:hypothetical protein [Bacillota bacterium]MDK2924737.1 hypothetical protein [Bacillota bacterium]MDK2960599.1 hypothetical protein [Bacillota bacterium]